MEPFSTKKTKNRAERDGSFSTKNTKNRAERDGQFSTKNTKNGTWNDQKKNEEGWNNLAEGPLSRTERNDLKKVGLCPALVGRVGKVN